MLNSRKELLSFLKTAPDTLQIIEQEQVSPETRKAYKAYSNSFSRGQLSEEETHSLGQILLESKEKVVKRKAMTLLAHTGSIPAFREIHAYYTLPETPLKEWAALAMNECLVNMENDAIDISSTGLGSVGNKFRTFVMLLSPDGSPFDDAQIEIIQKEFTLAGKDLNCDTEKVFPIENCTGILILIPTTVALDNIVSEGIRRCNTHAPFVFEHYYAAFGIPTPEEIPEIIQKIKAD